MDLSIVIVSYRCAAELRACLCSLYVRPQGVSFETIVVDNASGDGTAEVPRREFPQVRLIESGRNAGFAAGNNLGLREAKGRHLMLLNPDTEVRPGALEGIVRWMDAHPETGIMGPRMEYGDGRLQRSCGVFPTARSVMMHLWLVSELFPMSPLFAPHKHALKEEDYGAERPVDWVGGACLVIRREALEKIGPMDEGYFMFCEEMDWCLRARAAGYDVRFAPAGRVVHHSSRSVRQNRPVAVRSARSSLLRFFRKHRGPGQTRLLALVMLPRQAADTIFFLTAGLATRGPRASLALARVSAAVALRAAAAFLRPRRED
jgi:N-acetylglucosaminyl-diphospho-decaprenol L-rhamnosyltransferase